MAGPSGIITLLTDFGLSDAYVGAVKGAVLAIAPRVTLVDITHQVPPQNIRHGAYLLGQSWHTFPPGTVHLAVVDPGVGTARRGLAFHVGGHYLVGPDNGLFTCALFPDLLPRNPALHPFAPFIAAMPDACEAVVLDKPSYWRHPVSSTFHARDVFGPVAARLASGIPLSALGTPTSDLTTLYIPRAVNDHSTVWGLVLHVDVFGNLLTNIPAGLVAARNVRVEVAGRTIYGLSSTYGAATGLAAVVSSNGHLEIALPKGSAARELGVVAGEPITVQLA
jgi:S-adenosylmethionine hydrolase